MIAPCADIGFQVSFNIKTKKTNTLLRKLGLLCFSWVLSGSTLKSETPTNQVVRFLFVAGNPGKPKTVYVCIHASFLGCWVLDGPRKKTPKNMTRHQLSVFWGVSTVRHMVGKFTFFVCVAFVLCVCVCFVCLCVGVVVFVCSFFVVVCGLCVFLCVLFFFLYAFLYVCMYAVCFVFLLFLLLFNDLCLLMVVVCVCHFLFYFQFVVL